MGRKRIIPKIDKIIYEEAADEYQHMYLMHFDSMKLCGYVFDQTHVHQSIEMIFCESGGLFFRISSGVGQIGPQQVLIINSYDTHYYYYNKDFKGYILVLSTDFIRDVLQFEKNEFNNIVDVQNEEDWNMIVNKLSFLFDSYEKMSFLSRKGHCLLLFDTLTNYDLVRNKSTAGTKDLAGQIFKYIEDNYMKKITLESIAKDFCYSKNYFCSIFSSISQNGMSFNAYLNYFRVKKVLEMRNDVTYKGVPTKTLVKSAGFSSCETYYRVLKQYQKYNK